MLEIAESESERNAGATVAAVLEAVVARASNSPKSAFPEIDPTLRGRFAVSATK